MRTDVKIGIAVGLVMGVLAVLYFMFSPGAEIPTPVEQVKISEQPIDEAPSIDTFDVIKPKLQLDDQPVVAPAGSPVEPLTQVRPNASEDASVSVDIAIAPVESVAVPPAGTASAPSASPQVAKAPAVSPPGPSTDVQTQPQLSVQQTTYVVKEGDMGFWLIAVKVYGDGKYQYLIAQANPGVQSTRLCVGQTLKIPALPADSSRPGIAPLAGSAGPVTSAEPTTGRGGRSYTVQKGDSFWSIAQKEYGDGNKWTSIASANPGVTALQPGMRLIIPSKSASSPPLPQTTAKPTTTSAAAGQSPKNNEVTELRPIFD